MRIKMDLRNCDCMDLMKEFPDKYFELAIVDPPYGISITDSGRLGKYNKNKTSWDDNIPDNKYFKELFRVSNNQIIWGGNYFYLPPTRGFIIWDKKQPENVSFASCEFAWSNFDRSAKTFYYSPMQDSKERQHPTQKPVALYKWLLEHYAKKGDKILDTHLGSMSSVIACFEMGYDITGSELDADYYKSGIDRVNKHTSQLRFDDFIEERI